MPDQTPITCNRRNTDAQWLTAVKQNTYYKSELDNKTHRKQRWIIKPIKRNLNHD